MMAAIMTGETCPPMICRIRSDRKSTRLNSSHSQISHAVFCLKKKQLIEVERQHAQARDRHETNDPTDDDTVERGERRIESRPPRFHDAMLLRHQKKYESSST